MLEQPDIDAIVVSTPDHWHALMTILACAAGKDVYVEKPLTHVHARGRVDARAPRRAQASRAGRHAAAFGPHYQRARTLIRDGHIGDVRGVQHRRLPQHHCPASRTPDGEPLSPAHWDMWLGPAPMVPFDPARGLYHFRWFGTTPAARRRTCWLTRSTSSSGSRARFRARVAAFAQRRSLTGFGETPDVLDAIFEYPSFLASWSSREVAAGGKGGLEIYGTKGTLSINRRGFEITPDKALTPESQIPRFTQPQAERARSPSHRGRQRRRLRSGARPVSAARQKFPRRD